jgi:hypothetical protein
MTKRSEQVFKELTSSDQKFEYFVLGLTVALFAYIGEKYVPQPLSLSQNTVELLALILLVTSILFGLKRMEMNITALAINYQKLHAGEKLASYKKGVLSGQKQIKESGEIFDPEQALPEIKNIEENIIPSYAGMMAKIDKKSILFYKIRDWSLLLGFVCLISAKLIGAICAANP